MNSSDNAFILLESEAIKHVSNRSFASSIGRDLCERIDKINLFYADGMYEEVLAQMRIVLEALIKYLYKTTMGRSKCKIDLFNMLNNDEFRSKIGDEAWLKMADDIRKITNPFHHSSNTSEETEEEYRMRKMKEKSNNYSLVKEKMFEFQHFIDSGMLLINKLDTPSADSRANIPCAVSIEYVVGTDDRDASLCADLGNVKRSKYVFSWFKESNEHSSLLLEGHGKAVFFLKDPELIGHTVKLTVTGGNLSAPLVAVYGPILKNQVRSSLLHSNGPMAAYKSRTVTEAANLPSEVKRQGFDLASSEKNDNDPKISSKAEYERKTTESACISWGPTNRPTYCWARPATSVTFNSITDNPSLGDERNFVRIKKYGTKDLYSDSVDLEVGAEYEVFIYYHNNASANLNTSGRGIATNVRLFVDQPNCLRKAEAGRILGRIHCAEVEEDVWDTAWLHTKSTVLLRYVANSAVLHTLGPANGTAINSNNLFGETGAHLAYSTNHLGVIPGCNEFSGYVTYRFKVDQAGFRINCYVKKSDDTKYGKKIIANPGDILDFMIEYQNTGTINQLSIIAYDHLPNGLEYLEGSSFFSSNFNKEGNKVSDKLFNGGINLGDYKPGDFMHLEYKVKILDDPALFPPGKEISLFNKVSVATQNGTGYVSAYVTVKR